MSCSRGTEGLPPYPGRRYPTSVSKIVSGISRMLFDLEVALWAKSRRKASSKSVEKVPTVDSQGLCQSCYKGGERMDAQPPSSSTKMYFDKSNPTGHSNPVPSVGSRRMSEMTSWCSNTDSALVSCNESKTDGPAFSSQRHIAYLKYSLRNGVEIIRIVLRSLNMRS